MLISCGIFQQSETSLDIAAMQKGAEILEGHHDFSSFQANGCTAKSAVGHVEVALGPGIVTYWVVIIAKHKRPQKFHSIYPP